MGSGGGLRVDDDRLSVPSSAYRATGTRGLRRELLEPIALHLNFQRFEGSSGNFNFIPADHGVMQLVPQCLDGRRWVRLCLVRVPA